MLPALLGIVPKPGLLFGLILLAAIVGGYAARWLRIPHIIGFLLGGAGLRATLHALLGGPAASGVTAELEASYATLEPIRDLALGMILFLLGGVFERTTFRSVRAHVFTISLREVLATFSVVFVACGVVAFCTIRGAGTLEILALAVLLAAAAIETAPAATLFVLHEYESKGPITNTILCLVGISSLLCICFFFTAFFLLAGAGLVESSAALAERPWLGLAAMLAGSFALGLICGVVLSITHAKLPLSETLLVFFALFILLGVSEAWLLRHGGFSFNFLLCAVVGGAVFVNIAVDAQKLTVALRTMGTPLFAGFFVIAGYGLHVEDFARMGLLGAAYVLARLVGKLVGIHWGVAVARAPDRADGRLGQALLSHASIVIGLAAFASEHWKGPMAKTFTTVALGSVVIFELIGPLLVKRCVVHAGEVKAVTLLRRFGMEASEGSVLKRTCLSLLRLAGLRRAGPTLPPDQMAVKHLMRSNVQLIPASASLDEVLHVIERSTYTHFPVVDDDGNYVGVIHFSDVRDVIYDPALRHLITALDFANAESEVVPMDMPLTDLLDAFQRENVAVLPVVDAKGSRRIVGLVEQRDLLGVFARRP
jgi:CBS domain-containing protein